MAQPSDYRSRCYDGFVSKHWQNSHDFSRETFELTARKYRKIFADILPTKKDARIIDIACGCGFFLYFLQKQGYARSNGIDLSSEQLRIAKGAGVRNVEKGDLFQYLEKFPRYFDMIVANDIIEHLTKGEVLLFLDRIHESLAKGGTALISTVNAHSLFGAGMVYNDFTHEQGFTPTSLTQVLRVCNFEILKVEGEKVVIFDVRSALRSAAWWLLEKVLKAYNTIERGTGRGLWAQCRIFEPRMYVVAQRNQS